MFILFFVRSGICRPTLVKMYDVRTILCSDVINITLSNSIIEL